jgi:uncharacterized protein YjbI with pentapeptide repeats
MANPDHLEILRQGVDAWNAWKEKEPLFTTPDLSGADLHEVNLRGANRRAHLSQANLSQANLSQANLSGANLSRAHLDGANFDRANLSGSDLSGAVLSEASLRRANLSGANLSGAILSEANLSGSDLSGSNLSGARFGGANFNRANLSGADLRGASLFGANLGGANFNGANLAGASLRRANLSGASLFGANLTYASLVEADITSADLSGCRIYGVSAWGLKLSDQTSQRDLIITRRDEPEITVDDIEVAQFIYLMLNNQKIRRVIEKITSKIVLILGRFTDERKAVLDALRDELRWRNYLPILFDFDKPASRTTDETITLLARMARFVIVDISDAKNVLQELRAIVPEPPSVPVQPVIIASQEEPGMFDFYRGFRSFLPVHRYDTPAQLLAELSNRIIEPSEAKALEFRSTSSAN